MCLATMSDMSASATLLENLQDLAAIASTTDNLRLMEEEFRDQIDLGTELVRLTGASMTGLKAGKKALDKRTLCGPVWHVVSTVICLLCVCAHVCLVLCTQF